MKISLIRLTSAMRTLCKVNNNVTMICFNDFDFVYMSVSKFNLHYIILTVFHYIQCEVFDG